MGPGTNKKLVCAIFILASIASSAAIAVSDEVAIPRLVELSRIPTAESASEVVALATEGSTNTLRLQFAITALIHIGPSGTGDAYAKGILDDLNSPPISIRGALAYFAERPESWMNAYATQYLADSFDGPIRSQAAYLAGALGLAAEIDTIKSIVLNDAYGAVRIEAAYGLANLVPETELEATIDATNLSEWDKELVRQLGSFLRGNIQEKDADTRNYINRSEFVLSLAAMRHLVETENQDLLRLYVVRGDQNSVRVPSPMHQTLLRVIGYEIGGNIDNLNISRLQPL